MGDLAAETVAALRAPGRSFVYAYHPDLDMTGHVRGVGSHAWRLSSASSTGWHRRWRSGCAGQHTGHHRRPRHGRRCSEDRIDFDQEPALQQGVRLLAGEPRRATSTPAKVPSGKSSPPGRSVWENGCGSSSGTTPSNGVGSDRSSPTMRDADRRRGRRRQRPVGIVQPSVLSVEAMLVGHHGSLTAAEQLVPFLAVSN